MNGTPEQNFNEAGSTGAYTGTHYPAGSEATGEASSAAGSYAASSAAGSAAYGAGYNATGSANYNTGAAGDSYAAGSYPPPPPGYAPPYGYGAPVPPPPGSPNPGLAALLGFIPGVGAMYNGQFAKGIAHIVIFAVLTSLADHANGVFGLLVVGWVFYMVFDAYQTARARREGLVAPDPFGLNNIGERFGMPHNPNWNDFVARPAGTSAEGAQQTAASQAGEPAPYGTTTNPYTAPGYAGPTAAAGSPYVPPIPGVPYGTGAMPPPWYPDYPEAVRQQAYADAGAPGVPYQATYTAADTAAVPPYPPQALGGGLPSGAIWLIGLGILALTGTLSHRFYWNSSFFGAFACFLFGAALLVQQTSVSRKLYPRGTSAFRWSLLHQARTGLLLLVVGILQLLAGLAVASWHYTWPYLLIALGLLQIADRALYNRMLADPPVMPNGFPPSGYPAPAAAPVAGATPGNASTARAEEEVR